MKNLSKILLIMSYLMSLLLMTGNVNAASVVLSDAPDYDWYLGCSPTSAAMMMGYYDINGYQGLSYDNLVSGTAELSSYNHSESNANLAIENLANYMGTTDDGGTLFYFSANGSELYYDVLISIMEDSGMLGIFDYVTNYGYSVTSLYNQLTDNLSDNGFSFDDYMAEIDAGRVVLIHVDGHTMFGYGYEYDLENKIYEIILHDTWSEGEHSLAWGESYFYYDDIYLDLFGVTVLELSGGSEVPVPASIFIFGTGLITIVSIKRRKSFFNE